MSDPVEPELQTAVSHHSGVLATEPRSAAGTRAINCCTVSPPRQCNVLYVLPPPKSTAFLCGPLLQRVVEPGARSRKLQFHGSWFSAGIGHCPSPWPLSLNSEAVDLSFECCLQKASIVKPLHALETEMRWLPPGKANH